jgi:hypothetical protein
VVAAKPYEVIAKCTMVGLPAASDIAAVGDRLDKARRQIRGVVRAAPQPPAVFRDGGYVVETRIVTWADDAEGAVRSARDLLETARVTWSELYPSGRVLSETDTPRAAAPGAAGSRAATSSRKRKAAPGRKTATKASKTKGRTAKTQTAKRRRSR